MTMPSLNRVPVTDVIAPEMVTIFEGPSEMTMFCALRAASPVITHNPNASVQRTFLRLPPRVSGAYHCRVQSAECRWPER